MLSRPLPRKLRRHVFRRVHLLLFLRRRCLLPRLLVLVLASRRIRGKLREHFFQKIEFTRRVR